jgi:hypothetical protein
MAAETIYAVVSKFFQWNGFAVVDIRVYVCMCVCVCVCVCLKHEGL